MLLLLRQPGLGGVEELNVLVRTLRPLGHEGLLVAIDLWRGRSRRHLEQSQVLSRCTGLASAITTHTCLTCYASLVHCC